MSHHRIQLRGPWTVHYLMPERSEETSVTIVLPTLCEDLLVESQVPKRCTRPFHRPTNLTTESVWVMIEGCVINGIVNLNDTQLGRCQIEPMIQEFQITDLLQPYNQLMINIEQFPQSIEAQPPIWKSLALEIRAESNAETSQES